MKRFILSITTIFLILSSFALSVHVNASSKSEDFKISDISHGAKFFLRDNGNLYKWSSKGDVTEYTNDSVELIDTNVKKLADGAWNSYHCMYIKNDDSLWGIGGNSRGQLGNGINTDPYVNTGIEDYNAVSKPIKIMENVQKVALGKKHTIILTKDGKVFTFGDNYYGQLGNGDSGPLPDGGFVYGKFENSPIQIMNDVKDISAEGDISSALRTNGDYYIWGDGSYEGRDLPQLIANDVKAIGQFSQLYIDKDDNLHFYYYGNSDNTTNKPFDKVISKNIKYATYYPKTGESGFMDLLLIDKAANLLYYDFDSQKSEIIETDVKKISQSVDYECCDSSGYIKTDGTFYGYDTRKTQFNGYRYFINEQSVISNLPEEKKFTEQEIYTKYPESLTNDTDIVLDNALNAALFITDNRSTWDDVLSSFKTASSNINGSLEYIWKFIFAGGNDSTKNIKYDEFVDEIVLKLLYDQSQNRSSLAEAYTNLSEKYKGSYSNLKKAFKYCDSSNRDIDTLTKSLGQTIGGDVNEIKDSLKKSYTGWDKTKSIFKKIDKGIEFADVYVLNIQIQQVQLELIDSLMISLPKNDSMQVGLIRLRNKLTDSFWNNVTNEFLKEEINNYIVSGLKDAAISTGLEWFLKSSATDSIMSSGFASLVGTIIVESIGNKIEVPTADSVTKANIYKGYTVSLYNDLLIKRTEFMNAFSNDEPIEDLNKKINSYRTVYESLMLSAIGLMEEAKGLGSEHDKNALDAFIEELKSMNYENYLNNCVKKIKKNSFMFSWRETTEGVAITGIKTKPKARIASEGFDGYYEGNIIVIPDEISDKKVISIDSNAIAGNYKGIILGENMKSLGSKAINTNNNLSFVKINTILSDFKNDSISNSSLIVSASKNYKNANTDKDVIASFENVISIDVVSPPNSLNYNPSKEYLSTGLKIAISNGVETREITEGWIENIEVENGLPQLHIIYEDAETLINLNLEKVPMEYNIHYLDSDYHDIIATKKVIKDGFSFIEEKNSGILGYTLSREYNNIYLNNKNKDVYLIYDKNLKLDNKTYIIDYKDMQKATTALGAAKVFKSSDENIFSVESDGNLIPHCKGVAILTVEDFDGNYDSAAVLVDDSIVSLSFEQDKYELYVGEEQVLNLTSNPINSTQKNDITFTSSDSNIAKIDVNGRLTALKEGSIDVNVKINNGIQATCKIKIINKENISDEKINGINSSKPNTGFSNNLNLYILLVIFSSIFIVASIYRKKYNK